MGRRVKRPRLARLAAALVAVVALVFSTMSALQPAVAAGNPYQRGPDPTVASVAANSRTDYDVARGTQLLAALDYLTQKSPVRDRVDPTRLGVVGHSMGGG